MQEIHLVGINHKTSKVSDRERFIVDDSNLVYLNDFLISKPHWGGARVFHLYAIFLQRC